MKAFISYVKKHALVLGIAGVIVIGGGAMLLGNGEPKEELLALERGHFMQEVSVSGKVVAADDVTLSFADSGRIASIGVEVGDTVGSGQALISLASETLISDLRAAEATLQLRKAEARNSTVNLDQVKEEQDALVESAYRTLLSDDLAAVPDSSYGVKAPVITGLYAGPEGSYRVRVTAKENSDDFELNTFGLEDSGPVEIQNDEPTVLGAHGLFIDFPDALLYYEDTIWHVVIPNTKGASYLSNRRAYEEALSTRDRVISQTEDELRSGPGGSIADARIQSAEAEVARIRAAIAERTLRAPFAGVITAVDAKLGETAQAGAEAVSLISTGSLQIESYVPEINISLVKMNQKAKVTLDAYGDDVIFDATVVSVDPAETVRDGVSTYRIVLQFAESDERVRSGMTANVRIVTDERDGVLSVPEGIIIERDGKKYVQVETGEDTTVEREVTTGAVSNLGNVEILSGLSEGETVVVKLSQ